MSPKGSVLTAPLDDFVCACVRARSIIAVPMLNPDGVYLGNYR